MEKQNGDAKNGIIPLNFVWHEKTQKEKAQTEVAFNQPSPGELKTTAESKISGNVMNITLGTVSTLDSVVEVEDPDNSTPSLQPGSKSREVLRLVVLSACILGYFTYFTAALVLNFQQAIPVLVLTLLAVVIVVKRLGLRLWRRFSTEGARRRWARMARGLGVYGQKVSACLEQRAVKVGCYLLCVAAMLAYIVAKNYTNLESMKPALGLLCIVIFCWTISYDRSKIYWRPVIWGLAMQMVLGLFVLRTSVGAEAFRFIGHQFETFLNYVVAGVTFVFGEKYEDFFFVFKLMPTLIFISSAMSILYHFGAMQWIIDCIAYAMAVTMGTTAAESTSTAACIFLGQPEASLTIRPFLHLMTRSELFAILTAGFASVTVDVFSIFVSYGMSSTDIITAVLMSAPASIAVSKLICPETEVSQTKTLKDINAKSCKKTENVVEAAITGAQDAVSIIASVIAALIAFLSLFEFLNAVVTYLGSLVNIEGLTIDGLIAYPLMPVVYLLGVPWDDCRVIGEVVALKTFVNELVAYQRLSEMVKAGRVHTKRSQIVAMYALCGFSNPTSVGVSLGGLSAMVPEKKMVLSRIILMSWLSGCLACFMTAAWAGLLYVEDISQNFNNFTITTNITEVYT